MKHYIYIDNEIVNSYISQIYDGILKGEKIQKQSENGNQKDISNPIDKINATIDGGLPGVIKGAINTEHTNRSENYRINENLTFNEVIEKIYHDNLLDNLIEYIENKEVVINNTEAISTNKYVHLNIPFNFSNADSLSSFGSNEFKNSFQKIVNSTNAMSTSELSKIKNVLELIGNFAKFFESSFPTKYLIITEKLIIPLSEKFFRESPDMIDFKYGGNINIFGKVTKYFGEDLNISGLFNKEFAESLGVVKESLYNIYLPNYSKSYVITPIALYFE